MAKQVPGGYNGKILRVNLSDNSISVEKARSYYYTLMGWDERTGIPKPERLEELDIP